MRNAAAYDMDGLQPMANEPRAMALAEITRAIAASLDVSRIFGVVAQQAADILDYHALAVLLLHPGQDGAADPGLSMAFCHPSSVEAGHLWSLADFSFGPALLANQPVVIKDFAATTAQHVGDQALVKNLGRAALIVPIQVAPHVQGGLAFISRTPRFYRPEDARLVEPIAALLGLALEHQRLEQQARALAVAEERNRLAREIHDTLAHSITSIIINLASLKPYAAGRSQGEAEVLAETEGLARGALTEARRSFLGLQPTPLQHQSLQEALAPELAGLAKRAGLGSQCYVHGEERRLAPDVTAALFRVAQEAFHNIEKHAAARHVILGLAFEVDALVLTVEDDGVGFDPTAVGRNDRGGFGLLSMAARVRSLGGALCVTSHPGHGTAVRATLPYVRPAVAPAAVVLPVDTAARPAPGARPIRVLIVDDHPVVRQGIRGILDEQPDIQVVGQAEDGLAAIEQTGRLRPDVVLLDLQMPRLSGIEALPRLRAAHPPAEVVVLSVCDQDEQVFASLKAGARGYILKDAAPEVIVAAVRAASHGQSALPPTLTTRVVERFSVLSQREVEPDALSEREREVLGYMAKGLPYKAIAAQLHVSINTIQYHVTNILQKLHASNRSEAVAMARQRGLFQREK
ncbi:MAG: response regulator [Chloroflexi bacterium]|nr:response regulator [Chloroflexota bacterium]